MMNIKTFVGMFIILGFNDFCMTKMTTSSFPRNKPITKKEPIKPISTTKDFDKKMTEKLQAFINDPQLMFKQGNEKTLEHIGYLVNQGANPNIQNNEGTHLLLIVVSKTAWVSNALGEKIVKTLIDKGANVNAKDRYGQSVLYFATISSSPDVIKMLLEKGADPNFKNEDGFSALDVANRQGFEHIKTIFDSFTQSQKLQ